MVLSLVGRAMDMRNVTVYCTLFDKCNIVHSLFVQDKLVLCYFYMTKDHHLRNQERTDSTEPQ